MSQTEADHQSRRTDAVVQALHWNWMQRTPGACSFGALPREMQAEFYARARDLIDAYDVLAKIERSR